VKKAFKDGQKQGLYVDSARDVIRARPEETRLNPRASSAKLRWACRA
jgi:16S rRNA (cytosine1402-N4)-methyltransferase